MTGQWLAISFLGGSLTFVAASQVLIKGAFLRVGAGTDGGESWQALIMMAVREPWMWAGVFTLITGAVLWYLALSQLPLSLVVPSGALVAPLAVICAHFVLGEPLTFHMICAMIVIALGLIWLSILLT